MTTLYNGYNYACYSTAPVGELTGFSAIPSPTVLSSPTVTM